MSYHARNLSGVAARHPIVLRFAELRPEDLAKFVMHMKRAGGDLSHVDPSRGLDNERLIGDEDWVEAGIAEIDYMRHANFTEELQALKARKRRKEMDARILQWLVDPWKKSKGGPLREVILTANKDWFEETSEMGALFDVNERAEREDQFKAHAVEWLKSRFGDAVIHAHADHDETTCHIHAIIMPRHEKTSARRGTQRLLQPSAYPLLKNYEDAQDDAGAFFAKIGLKRGARGAAAQRLVLETNEKARKIAKMTGEDPILQSVPVMPEHVPTPVWWAQEVQRLKDQAEALTKSEAEVLKNKKLAEKKSTDAERAKQSAQEREDAAAKREKDADSVMAVAEAVSSGLIEFGGTSREIDQTMRASETDKERSIQERLKVPGSKTRSFFQTLRRSYAQMSSKAEENAAQNLAAEVKSVRVAARAIETLKATILKHVPPTIRQRLLREMFKVDLAEKKMEEKLKSER